MRAELAAARAAMQAAQQRARELAVQVESRRCRTHRSTTRSRAWISSFRISTQRRDDLARQLADGEAPLAALAAELERALTIRAQIEAELHAARIASEELDALLREREARHASRRRTGRIGARGLGRGSTGRAAGARAPRERRRAAGGDAFELADLIAGLAADATVETWEASPGRDQGQDRAPRPGQSRGDRRIQGAIGAQGIPGPPVQGSDRRAGDPRVGHAQDRPRDPHALRGYLRSGQCRPQGELPAAVRRRPCLSGAHGRGSAVRRASPSWRVRRASATAPSASSRAARRRSPPWRWCSRSST